VRVDLTKRATTGNALYWESSSDGGPGFEAAADRTPGDSCDTRRFGEVEAGMAAITFQTLEHLSLDELHVPSRRQRCTVLCIRVSGYITAGWGRSERRSP